MEDYKYNKKAIILYSILFLGLILAVLTALFMNLPKEEPQVQNQQFQPPKVEELINVPFIENRDIYSGDKANSIVYLYVTVFPDVPNDSFTSFDKVNNYQFSFETSVEKTVGKAIVQQGDETGPKVGLFGYGENTPNTTIEVKGRSTTRTAYKSYKLTLTDRNGFWQGQKVINLNKHPFDITRVRNKLSSDYFKIIPNIVSYRTQFVDLKVKDLSEGNDAKFVDYGLFTQTEQINKKYLKTHGLDPSGSLYKANFFEFYRYPDLIKTVDDPTYDFEKFNHILEIQGSEDHTALIAMLDDLNNYALDIDDVINTHFNRENFLTWFAINIVFGNIDTNNENFFLYKPINTKKWSFIPWDYDNAWGVQNQNNNDASLEYSPWQKGIQNFWTPVLQNRFLRKEANRQALDQRIQEILAIATEEQTNTFLREYYPIVSSYVNKVPDLVNIGVDMNGFAKEYNRLQKIPAENYQIYKASLERPMPVYMWTQERVGDKDKFGWDLSFDFQDDEIFYDFYLSREPNFDQVLITKKNLSETEIEVDALPVGTYYWKLIIRDDKGHEMTPFDTYRDLNGKAYFGVKEYIVR